MNIKKLTQKKLELDRFRPLPDDLLRNLEDWYRVELTYTSNAIEGNTLSRAETSLIIEKGITVGGKTICEHLEALNHAAAYNLVKKLSQNKNKTISEKDILQIHSLILKDIDNSNAGRYRNVAVRISGSEVILPNPLKVPILMHDFFHWLKNAENIHPANLAAEAHYRLVTIHPFFDGNGRSARLLMNLILMIHGYPPAIIRLQDRLSYIKALEIAQLGGSKSNFLDLIIDAVDMSLDIYLNALNPKEEKVLSNKQVKKLLKIGELAKAVEETTSTIRFWTKEGLLEIAATTGAGYHLYDEKMIARIKQIKKLQSKRYTILEIKGARKNK